MATSSGFRDGACRIYRSAASGRIAPASRGYALCRAAVSLPRNGRTVIRPSLSSPGAWILYFGRIRADILCATASPTQRRETDDCCTSHSLQPVTCLPDGLPKLRIPHAHFQALPRCLHRICPSLQFSFRSDVSTPTSHWSPSGLGWDHQFSGPRDLCGKYTASTSSTPQSLGEFSLGRLSTAVATFYRSWGSVTRRLRPTDGLAGKRWFQENGRGA